MNHFNYFGLIRDSIAQAKAKVKKHVYLSDNNGVLAIVVDGTLVDSYELPEEVKNRLALLRESYYLAHKKQLIDER